MENIFYPRLIRRIEATLIDGMIIAAGILAVVFYVPAIPRFPELRGVLVIAIALASEPILVALTGGTIGHHLIGMRVTRLTGTGNINFFAATVRFAVKIMLGWLSLIMALVTQRHQAVHDLIARSLIVCSAAERLPSAEKLCDRSTAPAHIDAPPWRRVVVTIVHVAIFYSGYAVALLYLSTSECDGGWRCDPGAALIDVAPVIWWAAAIFIMIFGYKGYLLGARRKKRA